MPPILPHDHRNRQALHRLQRYVANNFITEVEEARGSTTNAACDTKAKLVEAKLEMVRAARVVSLWPCCFWRSLDR